MPNELATYRNGGVGIRVALCCAVVLLSSCGWQRKLAWQSPDGKSEIEIQQKLPINYWGLRVTLTASGKEIVLLEQRGDSAIKFSHVYWEGDGSAVAVYGCGIQNLSVAYSIKGSRLIPFDRLAGKVAASIRAEYGLPPDKDDKEVFVWTCSWGEDAFAKKHPNLY